MARKYNIQMILGAVDKASPKLKTVGKNMAIMGAAVSAATVLMMKSWMNAGDEIEKMSRRVGVSTTTLSEFKHAAELSGASLEDVEKGMKKMSKTLVDAEDGMTEYIRAFELIGLESAELIALKPEEQFIRISEAIADLESPTLRAAAAQDIFGRAGTKLLPMFDAGSEGLRAMREEAHELGIVFDEAGAKRAAEFTDNMLRLKASVRGVFLGMADQLFPMVDKLVTQIKDVVVNVRGWMEENKALTKVILTGTVALGGMMAALGPVLLVIPTLAASIKMTLIPAVTKLYAIMAAHPLVAVAAGFAMVTLAVEKLASASIDASNKFIEADLEMSKTMKGRIELQRREADEMLAHLTNMINAKRDQTEEFTELEERWLERLQTIKFLESELERTVAEEKTIIRNEELESINQQQEMIYEAYAAHIEQKQALAEGHDAFSKAMAQKELLRQQKLNQRLILLGRDLVSTTSAGFAAMFKEIGKGGDVFAKGMKKVWVGMTDVVIDMIAEQMAAQVAQWFMLKVLKIEETKTKMVAAHASIPFVGLAIGLAFAAAAAAAIKGFAAGGVAKGLALVGERGPELINVGSPSRVFSSPESKMMLAGIGGLTINNIFTGNTIINDRALDDFSEKVGEKIYDQVKMEINN